MPMYFGRALLYEEEIKREIISYGYLSKTIFLDFR